MESDKLKNWFTIVLTGLVSKPEQITIIASEDDMGIRYTVRVAKVDIGKVLGKKGAIADALRTILRSAGFVLDVRVSLRIETSEETIKPR